MGCRRPPGSPVFIPRMCWNQMREKNKEYSVPSYPSISRETLNHPSGRSRPKGEPAFNRTAGRTGERNRKVIGVRKEIGAP